MKRKKNKLNIDFYKAYYFTFDKPVEWKGLLIHPIKVKDWLDFASCVTILDLEKNETGDIEVIKMSYLKWILLSSYQDEKIGNDIMPRLFRILNLCFNTNNINFDLREYKDGKPVWIINDIELSAKDFDEFRKLIMYQNLPNYEDDSYMDADFKKAMEEYNDLKSRDFETPSLERQVVIVANERHCMEEQVFNMTYRKFNMALAEINGKIEYQIYKTAETSGMVEFKQPIDHWIYKAKKNRFEGIVDAEEFTRKIESING